MSGSTAHRVFVLYKGLAECFMKDPSSSHFTEKGVLTPEEFVLAGDLLVKKCPTWRWSGGERSKQKNNLPPEKQFLITRNVPCLKRCKDLIEESKDEGETDDGWITTHLDHVKQKKEEKIADIDDENDEEEIGEDEIVDIDDFNQENQDWDEEEDEDVVPSSKNSNIVKTRTYDLSITYDKYYQTPRVWLFGYSESGNALTTKEVLEDIHVDYSHKTVTIEQHPHLNVQVAGVHPCKHASVMKKMIDLLAEKDQYPRVDLYLFLFLKFISSVIPTVLYDFTIEVDNK